MTHWEKVRRGLVADPTFRHQTAVKFWSRVNVIGDGCWEWKLSRNESGHGRWGLRGGLVLCNRLALQLDCVDVPEDSRVCHRCDNPACCRPSHLYVGDAKSNSADMVRAGRHGVWTSPQTRAKGQGHGRSKLSEASAQSLLTGELKDTSAVDAAKLLGVTTGTIYLLRKGKTWSHLARG